MKKLHICLLFLSLIMLVGCEYSPMGENIIDLKTPDKNIPVAITLNNVNPADTIYVYQTTSVTIQIKSTKSLVNAEVMLNNNVFATISQSFLSFDLIPGQLADGVYKLSVNANFTSGTGSLAEQMGMEQYSGGLSWTIRVISHPENYFKADYRLNKEGYLEYYWSNKVPPSCIDRYEIHSGLSQPADTVITDPEKTSFVDYGFECGYTYCQITTYLKGGFGFTQSVSITKPTPKIYAEYIDLKHFRVYWEKSYANARYKLTVGGNVIATDVNDTSYVVPQIFGAGQAVNVEIRPRNKAYDNIYNKYTAYTNYFLGSSLGLGNWPLFAYNKKDNILYSTTYGSLVAINATTMKQINYMSIAGHPWGLAYGGKLATAPHNSTVLAMTGEETWIYSDSYFNNPLLISSVKGDVNTHLSALTSDDRFFVVPNGTSTCNVYSSITGIKLFDIPFTYNTIYTFPEFVGVSENGQYFWAASENGIEVFEVIGTTTQLIYTDTRFYKGALSVPSHPDQIICRVGQAIEHRHLPDFSLIQSMDVTTYGAVLCNVDPGTMNFLYHQNDSLRVCNVNDFSKTIFQIRSDERTCKIYNNKVLTFGLGPIYIDITPYLNNWK